MDYVRYLLIVEKGKSMSHTDKDRPKWVRANDSTENRRTYHRQYSYDEYLACWQGCTVNTSTEKPWNQRDKSPCGYELDISWHYHCTPSRRDRRYQVYGPTRAVERAYTRIAADSYNTFGEDWDDEGIQFVPKDGKNIRQWWGS